MTAGGKNAGTVAFEQVDHGVVVTARLQNPPEGPHGFHIDEAIPTHHLRRGGPWGMGCLPDGYMPATELPGDLVTVSWTAQYPSPSGTCPLSSPKTKPGSFECMPRVAITKRR
jgi:hypothetical protein